MSRLRQAGYGVAALALLASYRSAHADCPAPALPPEKWREVKVSEIVEGKLETKDGVVVENAPDGTCISQVRVIGQQSREIPWDELKHAGSHQWDRDGIHWSHPRPGRVTVANAVVINVEDAIGPPKDLATDPGASFIVRDIAAEYIRDDFLENDASMKAEVSNVLVDRTHMFVSEDNTGRPRIPAGVDPSTWKGQPLYIHDSVVWLSCQPDTRTSKNHTGCGPSMTAGELFKQGTYGSRDVRVENVVARIDGQPASGVKQLVFPGTYRNVTIVWRGPGAFPANVPPGVTVTTDLQPWLAARAAFKAAHPGMVTWTVDGEGPEPPPPPPVARVPLEGDYWTVTKDKAPAVLHSDGQAWHDATQAPAIPAPEGLVVLGEALVPPDNPAEGPEPEPPPPVDPTPDPGPDPQPPAPPAPPVTGAVTVLAAGDLASCSKTADSDVAKLLSTTQGPILALGDLVYSDGTPDEYKKCFDPVFGTMRDRFRPTPGNHDYHSSGAPGYFGYFTNLPPYYSFEPRPGWTFYALNQYVATGPGSEQLKWFQGKLASDHNPCKVAYFHQPYLTSGSKHHDSDGPKEILALAFQAHFTAFLAGHNHHYERFDPIAADRKPSPTGVRMWTVGTGGADMSGYPFGTPRAGSQVRGMAHGVLQLTLDDKRFAWRFLNVPGEKNPIADAGSAACPG